MLRDGRRLKIRDKKMAMREMTEYKSITQKSEMRAPRNLNWSYFFFIVSTKVLFNLIQCFKSF